MLLSSRTTRVALPFVLLFTAIDACAAYFYEKDHFGGSWWGASPGDWANVWRHDVTSSMKIVGSPGCYAIVYEHGNFGGWAKRLDVGTYTKAQLAAKGVWNDAISSVKVRDLCNNWGCTCQGLSDKYEKWAHVSWGTVNQQADSAMIKKWWSAYNCQTKPACSAWNCKCQDLSNKWGAHAGVHWGTAQQDPLWPKIKAFWDAKGCHTVPTNRCLSKHCNGHWKLKSASWKIVCNGGKCQTNTNMCCTIENCDKVRVVSIKYKENDWNVGKPVLKDLADYTVEGNNCGVSQEKSLDSFIKTKEVTVSHEETLTLGTSLEKAFGWAITEEKTVEFSESATTEMEIPLSKAGGSVGASQTSSTSWGKTSSFAVNGGIVMGSDQIATTARSIGVTETIEFQGIKQNVPAYAWHRHKVQYVEREVTLNLELTVQCIVQGKNAKQITIPDSQLITAIESSTYYAPLEDRTDMCKDAGYPEYGNCQCFPEISSDMHTEFGCQQRVIKGDGTKSAAKGCYVYKNAGCLDAIGLKDADPKEYLHDIKKQREISVDWNVDGSTFRWSYYACIPEASCAAGYTSNPGDISGGGFSSTKVNSGSECAQKCGSNTKCRSYQYSSREKRCLLHTSTMPTAVKYRDYIFCTKNDASCTVSSGWCKHEGGTTSKEDCDGDGVLDEVCRDTSGAVWVLQSANNCAQSRKCPACTVSSGFCAHAGGTHTMQDCDGDGILDNVCRDTKGKVWVVQSAKKCAQTRSCAADRRRRLQGSDKRGTEADSNSLPAPELLG